MPADSLAPPRPELLALLDAIKDHPDDDTPRLVLADWLDEQDDPLDAERAAFIRASVAEHCAGLSSDMPSAVEMNAARYNQHNHAVFNASEEGRAAADERAATEERLRRWLGTVGATAYGGRFYRGLPILIVPGTWFFRSEVTPLLATEAFAFVQFLQLAEVGGSRMTFLANLPEFRFVPGVSADPFTALGTHNAAKFFGSPHLTGLRQIDFRGVDPGDQLGDIATPNVFRGDPAVPPDGPVIVQRSVAGLPRHPELSYSYSPAPLP